VVFADQLQQQLTSLRRKKFGTLDDSVAHKMILKHRSEFEVCPKCFRYVPKGAGWCWSCGANLAVVLK
jgi:predicted amidophosphoribosyltransferase